MLKGFEEKTGIREFLFALPKLEVSRLEPTTESYKLCYRQNVFYLYLLSIGQSDRCVDKRRSHVGTIEVLRHEGNFVKEEYRPISEVSFSQASKANASDVTGGKYTMSTTKKGRFIHRSKPYAVQLKTLWKIGRECGRLSVHYRMPHCLREMGIELKTVNWSNVITKEADPKETRQQSLKETRQQSLMETKQQTLQETRQQSLQETRQQSLQESLKEHLTTATALQIA